MDAIRFDRFARSFTGASSRRALVQGVATTAMGLAALRLSEEAEAKKHHKRKKRCKKLGQSCRRGGQRRCCQGAICDDFALDRFRCCKADGESCIVDSECCAKECFDGVCTPS
jgi:CelD/BcsL family acetyltransferase involved in cellulose biosynthesis